VIDVDTAKIPAGRQPVTVYVFSDAGRFIAKESTSLTFGRTRGVENVPFLMTGSVKDFYFNRAGLVSALRVQGAGTEAWIHFVPSQAQSLMDVFPLNGKFAGWVQKDEARGSDNFVLLAAGESKPATFVTPALQNEMQRLQNDAELQGDVQSVEGKLSGAVIDDEGHILALRLEDGSFVRVAGALRKVPTTPNSLVLARGSTIRFQVRPELAREGEVSAFSNRWVASEIEADGRLASAVSLPVLTLKQVREISGVAPTSGTGTRSELEIYLPPLPTDSATARTRGGGLSPIVPDAVRPW
jgi:hypothetical protein